MERTEYSRASAIKSKVKSVRDTKALGLVACSESFESVRISNYRIRCLALLSSDVLVVLAGYFAGFMFGSMARNVFGIPSQTAVIPHSYIVTLSIFVLPFVLIIGSSIVKGHYTQPKTLWSEVKDIFMVGIYAISIMSMILFFDKGHYSRLYVTTFWIFIIVALPFGRYFAKSILRKRGFWFVPISIVGNGVNAQKCADAFANNEMLGYWLTTDQKYYKNGARLFAPDSIDEYYKNADLIETSLREKQSIMLSTPLFGLAMQNAELVQIPEHDTALIKLHNNLQKRHYLFAKRLFDVVVSLLLILIAFPLIISLYVFVTADSGSFLYKQKRIGRNGKLFNCWKIRSMVPDAEARLIEYFQSNPQAKAEWDRTFKLKDDPRITRIGRFIRKTSIDELPQIWNVLIGDMSLVGPRPIVVEERNYYGKEYCYYTDSKPGITGMWQISGRNDTKYSERVKIDVAYSRNWSLWLDIVILLKTIPIVMNRKGAY